MSLYIVILLFTTILAPCLAILDHHITEPVHTAHNAYELAQLPPTTSNPALEDVLAIVLPPDLPLEPISLQTDTPNQLEFKLFPTHPTVSSWTYWEFMPLTRELQQGSIVTFTINLNDQIVDDNSYDICPLPRPINRPHDASSTGFSPGNVPSSIFPQFAAFHCGCTATSPDDPKALSPHCVGTLRNPRSCTLSFTLAQDIPREWLISCLVEFPKQISPNDAHKRFRIAPYGASPGWELANRTPMPNVHRDFEAFIWVDLKINYEPDLRNTAYPMDKLTLTFYKLPPSKTIQLNFALCTATSPLDRLVQFPEKLQQMIAEIIDSTDFPAKVESDGTRIVFALQLLPEPPSGLYIVTDATPAEISTFVLPIPRNQYLQELITLPRLALDITAWHQEQIALFVQFEHRLFRFETTHPRAKWNINHESFHHAHFNQSRHLLIRNDDLKDISTDLMQLTWDIILIGPRPSLVIDSFDIPFFDTSSSPGHIITLKDLFTPIDQGGFLTASSYINQPNFIPATPTPIPILLYDPAQSSHTNPTYLTIKFDINDPTYPYNGYANVTLAFTIPRPKLQLFSLNLKINSQHNLHLSIIYPPYMRASSLEVKDAIATTITVISFLSDPLERLPHLHLRGTLITVSTSRGKQRITTDSTYFENFYFPWNMAMTARIGLFSAEFITLSPRADDSQQCSLSYSDSTTGLPVDRGIFFKQYGIPDIPEVEFRSQSVTSGFVHGFDKIISKDTFHWVEIQAPSSDKYRLTITCELNLSPLINLPQHTFFQRIVFRQYQAGNLIDTIRLSTPAPVPPVRHPRAIVFSVQYLHSTTTKAEFLAFLEILTDIVKHATCRLTWILEPQCMNNYSSLQEITMASWFFYIQSNSLYQTIDSSPFYPVSLGKAPKDDHQVVTGPFSAYKASISRQSALFSLVIPYEGLSEPPFVHSNFQPYGGVIISDVRESHLPLDSRLRAIDFDPSIESNSRALPDGMSCQHSYQCLRPDDHITSVMPLCLLGRCRTWRTNAGLPFGEYEHYSKLRSNVHVLSTLSLDEYKETELDGVSTRLKIILIGALIGVIGIALIFAGFEVYKTYQKKRNNSEHNQSLTA